MRCWPHIPLVFGAKDSPKNAMCGVAVIFLREVARGVGHEKLRASMEEEKSA